MISKSKQITVVGLGQAGGILSYKLLKEGYPIRVLDARPKHKMECQSSVQTPWGWYRKFSLQSSLKKNLMTPEFPVCEEDIETIIHTTKGPMLITSKQNSILPKWKEWMENHPETDAHILNPYEANRMYDIPESYFKNNGGVFVCDTRDTLIDFGKLNQYLWKFLMDHPNCEFVDDCRLLSIHRKNNTATALETSQGTIPIGQTILSIGNQTSSFLDNLPIIQLRLPYIIGSDTQNICNYNKYVSVWNKDSSVLFYLNGDIKIGCGVQSIFDYKNTNLKYLHHFIPMGLKGLSNLNLCNIHEQLIDKAKEELLSQKMDINTDSFSLKYCNIDMTPNLCPYIFFPEQYNNILSISGFSGSGSMILDNHLTKLIIQSVLHGVLEPSLRDFHPNQSIYNHWFPPKHKQTPLSSII